MKKKLKILLRVSVFHVDITEALCHVHKREKKSFVWKKRPPLRPYTEQQEASDCVKHVSSFHINQACEQNWGEIKRGKQPKSGLLGTVPHLHLFPSTPHILIATVWQLPQLILCS